MTGLTREPLAAAKFAGRPIASERAVFMMIRGRPLDEVLAELALGLEADAPGAKVSIFQVNEEASGLRLCAAPSLPKAYRTLFAALEAPGIDESWAQLGEPFAAAIAHNCCLLVPDLQHAENWEALATVLRLSSLESLRVLPIHSHIHSVIGLLVVHQAAGVAWEQVPHLAAYTAQLAGMAILRGVAETAREHLMVDLQFERVERETLSLELQQAARAREQFMSIAAHELRTPLSVLMLQADSAARLMRRNDLTAERLQHKVAAIQKQVDRMKHLVEELLDVSQVVEGRLQLHVSEVDLASITREAIERVSEAFARAHCELRTDIPSHAKGSWDGLRLSQVVTNLLMNGLKYGLGAPVDVRLEVHESHARLSVIDHGIGIAPEQQARIFERFGRVVSEKNYGGFGLGLWLSKQIVEAMGGHIEVRSAAQAGATFVIILPRGPRAQSPSLS